MPSETAEDARPPPTFEGRLKLGDFMFNAAALSAGPRRSPRLSAAASTGPAGPSSTAITPTPRSLAKRKALVSLDDGDVSSPSSSSSSSKSPSRSSSSNNNKNNKNKRARQRSSGYAPPSTYAHLPRLLRDALAPNLLILFVGLNPGIETARTGHAYAHPTNLFWRLLHSSGLTPRLCAPAEDRQMPALYSLGLTNIVARPSRNGAELSKAEMDAGVEILERKVRRWRPEAVCVVGKSIWESLWRVRHGRAIRPHEFSYGWQAEAENMGIGGNGEQQQMQDEREEGVDYAADWKGARIFVASSTSGLAATLKPKEKEEIWKWLGDWAQKRRAERAAAAVAGPAATPAGVEG